MLRICIGFNTDPDPDPTFYLNADLDHLGDLLPVSCMLGNLALPVSLAVITQLFTDGSLEEPLAAFAADGPVVST